MKVLLIKFGASSFFYRGSTFLSLLFLFLFFLSHSIFAASLATIVSKNVWVPGWQPTSSMTIARAGAAIVSYKNKIYILGGVDGVNFLSSVEVASIKQDGNLSPWKVVSQMPEQRGFISATVYADRVYVVGGGNGPYGKHLLNSIISAPFLPNGDLGEWRLEEEKMLTPRRCSKLFVKNNEMFVVGGFGGALLDTVERTVFLADGKLAPWKMSKNLLTMPRYVNEVKKVGGYAVVLGGHHPTKGLGIKNVEFADLSRSTLDWKKAKELTVGRYAFSSATFGSYLYALGGISGTEYLNSIERLYVGKNGKGVEKNSWVKLSNLPMFMANFTTLVIGDRIYVLGGSTRHKYLPNVWASSLNDMGDIGYYGTKRQFDDYSLESTEHKADEIKLPNAGIVREVIETSGYTYIRVYTGSHQDDVAGEANIKFNGKANKAYENWIAVPEIDVSVNQKIRYSEGVYMSNFRSKTLGRNFSSILFAGTVKIMQ